MRARRLIHRESTRRGDPGTPGAYFVTVCFLFFFVVVIVFDTVVLVRGLWV